MRSVHKCAEHLTDGYACVQQWFVFVEMHQLLSMNLLTRKKKEFFSFLWTTLTQCNTIYLGRKEGPICTVSPCIWSAYGCLSEISFSCMINLPETWWNYSKRRIFFHFSISTLWSLEEPALHYLIQNRSSPYYVRT